MNINIPEKYTDLYIKALEEKKKSLLQKMEQFKMEIEEIDRHIGHLTSLPLFQDESLTSSIISRQQHQYHAEWSWTNKITHYQELIKKLVKATDIVEFIMEKEPELNKAKVRSSVSAALSNSLKRGKYRKFKDPVSGQTYYGPTPFFLNASEPHIEFMPEELKERLLYNK